MSTDPYDDQVLMNILHIEDEPWDSGIAHYALTLACEQSRRGHIVSFWTRAHSPLTQQASRLGLSVREWPAGVSGFLLFSRQRSALNEINPNVINAHTGSSHLRAILLAAGRSCAVIRTRADARLAEARLFSRFVSKRTSAYIAANSALESSLRAAYPNSWIARVPQGISGPTAAPPIPDAPILGVLARLDPVKGHKTILSALPLLLKTHPSISIECAGQGQLLSYLSHQIAENGLGDRFHLLGRVADPWSFIAHCRIGIVASHASEAVSRAALEWMASGRPVIATSVGGLPEIVEHGKSGLLVSPGSPDELSAAIKELLNDPQKTAEMGRAARLRWEKFFNVPVFYELTQSVYEKSTRDLPH